MFSMFRKKRLDMRFVGPTLAQIEEIERLSGKSIGAIVSESVNVWNWLYKERLNGAQLQIQGPDPDAPPREVVFL